MLTILSGLESVDASQTPVLINGSGDRPLVKTVIFQTNFNGPPKVVVALTRVDFDKNFNSRVWVTAKNITSAGFDLEFRTWADTKLHSAHATWMAHGQQ